MEGGKPSPRCQALCDFCYPFSWGLAPNPKGGRQSGRGLNPPDRAETHQKEASSLEKKNLARLLLDSLSNRILGRQSRDAKVREKGAKRPIKEGGLCPPARSRGIPKLPRYACAAWVIPLLLTLPPPVFAKGQGLHAGHGNRAF